MRTDNAWVGPAGCGTSVHVGESQSSTSSGLGVCIMLSWLSCGSSRCVHCNARAGTGQLVRTVASYRFLYVRTEQ